MEYMKWEAFASYLDCWTNTFKSEPHNKDIEEVVRKTNIVLTLNCMFIRYVALFFIICGYCMYCEI